MKKAVAAALALCMLIMPVYAITGEPSVSAPSVVLMERESGEIIYEKNAHERLAPASVTKVMTLLLVMEALDDGRITLDDMVTTSANAASMGGSQIYLEEGEQMVLSDVLKAVVVSSANDGAVALAEHIYGSEETFVAQMNMRAQELGMTDTYFVNCTGLDDLDIEKQHLTCAYDIAIMSRELLKHEKIKEYTTIWMDTVRDGQFGLSNTNKLIRFYNGATGLKTGFTARAGYCLSASAMRDDMELIATVMNAESSSDRFETAKSLLDYGFANYSLITPELSKPTPQVAVELGEQSFVMTELGGDNNKLLIDKSLKSSVETAVEITESVEAPVEKGQKLGTMTLTCNGEVLSEIDVVAAADVERLGLFQIFEKISGQIFMSK